MRFVLKTKLILTAAAVLVVMGSTAVAQTSQAEIPERWDTGVSEPLWFYPETPGNQIEQVIARWETLGTELGRLETGSQAGDYGNGGETHGSLLRWSPTKGYVLLHVDKCAASVMGFSYGSVIATPTTLTLIPEADFRRDHGHGHNKHKVLSNKFLFVEWRSISYLVRDTDITDFLDSLAGLGKYNDSAIWDIGPAAYSKGGKETGTADDLPSVPPGYEKFIKRPINLTITAIGPRIVRRFRDQYNDEPQYESRTVVTISGGLLEGVKPGMKFHVLDSQESDQVVVRMVGAQSSRGEIIRFVEPKPKTHFKQWPDYDRYPQIKVGWNISTSIHKSLDAYRAADEQASQ